MHMGVQCGRRKSHAPPHVNMRVNPDGREVAEYDLKILNERGCSSAITPERETVRDVKRSSWQYIAR